MEYRYGDFTFTISAAELAAEMGWETKTKTGKLLVKHCPFCRQGQKAVWTFDLSTESGMYGCFKGNCRAARRGSFWNLLVECGRDPKQYWVKEKMETPSGYKNKNRGNKHMNKPNTNFSSGIKRTAPAANYVGSASAASDKDFKAPYTPALPLTAACREYVNNRLITDETIERFKLASKNENTVMFRFWQSVDAEDNPIRHLLSKHRPINPVKGEKAERDAGGKTILYGQWLVSPEATDLVITEGEFDAMVLAQAGVDNVVSVPSGSNDFTWVDHCWEFLEQFERIIIWYDRDDAGQKMLHKLALKLDRDKCWQIETDYKDSNDMLRGVYAEQIEKTGATTDAELETCLKAAHAAIRAAVAANEPYRTNQLINVGRYVEREGPREVTDDMMISRWSAIDAVTGGFRGGDTILIFGNQGHGKSTAVGNLICERLNRPEGKVLVYSGEMPHRSVSAWVDRMLAGPDHVISSHDDFSGTTNYDASPEAVAAMRRWYTDRFFIYQQLGALDFDDFFDNCEYAARRFGVNLIVVDSITTAIPAMDNDRFNSQAIFAYRCHEFALEYNVTIILMTHTTAEARRQEERIPSISDVRGSSEISDSLTHALCVWRVPEEIKERTGTEKNPNPFEGVDNVIKLVKNRERGTHVTVRMGHEETSKRLYAFGKHDEKRRKYGWQGTEAGAAVQTPVKEAASGAPVTTYNNDRIPF